MIALPTCLAAAIPLSLRNHSLPPVVVVILKNGRVEPHGCSLRLWNVIEHKVVGTREVKRVRDEVAMERQDTA